MIKNKNGRMCSFYASDYHFEMISLPYIDRKLDENKNVVVLTENNLEDTIGVLISKINLNEDKKNKILQINWNNDDLEKFKTLKDNIKEENETIIFIKGRQSYINNVNKNIETWIDNKDVEVIDCYEMEEVAENLDMVMNGYKKVLGTLGEKKIQSI